MGSLRGDNGGEEQSPGGGGLPDLPPEWGVVVIPDDLTELDRESAELRREQRRKARRNRWRKRFGLGAAPDGDAPPVGAPLLIMSIAIIAALTSLFAITLSTRATTIPEVKSTPAPATTPQMIDLSLPDAQNHEVNIKQTLPAVILLLDGCTCTQLITDTVHAAPPNVTVLVVDRTAPILPTAVRATALADPEQALLATYAGGPDRAAVPAGIPTAVLVDSNGTVRATVSPATTLASFQAHLNEIGE